MFACFVQRKEKPIDFELALAWEALAVCTKNEAKMPKGVQVRFICTKALYVDTSEQLQRLDCSNLYCQL